jgi:hypothetical protein
VAPVFLGIALGLGWCAVSIALGYVLCVYVVHPLVVRHHAAEPSRDGIAHVVGVNHPGAAEEHPNHSCSIASELI